VLGEALLGVLVLVPDLAAVDRDDEVTLAAGLLLYRRAWVGSFDRGGQTGRLW